MRLFDQLYAASATGRGAVLLVSGPVGSGKTALLQAMAARAGRQGGLCFVVTASAGERGHPFGVLHRLLQSMEAAGMEPPLPSGGMGADADFFAMMDRVCTAIRDFAGDRPVAICVDDVHFADEHSARCLSYLVRRIERCGAVMVLEESSSYEREMADLRAEMLHLPFCHRVRLEPLTAADIAEQVRERLCGEPDGAFVRFCAETSGGNPLLLHALIDDRAAASRHAGEPGTSFRQAVLRSLHRCAPSTAVVARAMAVLGDFATPALIAELGGVHVPLVREGARDLHEMGLLGPAQSWPWHARSAVLASIPLPDLPGMHSRAAQLLHESGAPAGIVAEHLIAAQDGGKDEWRVTILSEGAREAMAAGDIESAVNRLRHAVGSTSDPGQRARLGVALADAHWHADPSRAARRLHRLGRDARAGLLTGSDLLVVVNQLLWWGEFAEADELLRLSGADGGGDFSLAQLWAFFSQAGLGPETHEEAVQPADSPLAHSGPMAAATFLSSAATLAFDGLKADRADQMLLGIRAGTPLTPALYALVLLVRTGRLDEAIAWCDRLLKEDWIAYVPMRREMIEIVKAVAALRAGDSVTALCCIRELFDAVPPQAWGVVVGLPLSVAVDATTDLGDARSAQSYLAVPVPPAMFDTPFALPYLQAVGKYHLATGHPRCAYPHAQSCLELMAKWHVGAAGVAAASEWHNQAAAALIGPVEPRPDRLAADEPPADEPPADSADSAKLTYSEQRVAALAAAGNTNRRIAETLFITVSTVEQHLTKVYRKLNVRSRSELRRHSG